MTTTPLPAPPVLRHARLHCPKCATELGVWEETRHIDRVSYTRPEWDSRAHEWKYTRSGAFDNVETELLDRYAQCPGPGCGYLAPVEDRYDDELAGSPDELPHAVAIALSERGGCTYATAYELASNSDRVWQLLDALETDLTPAADTWRCPGCARSVEPSDVRRHASECAHVDGAGQPVHTPRQ